MTIVNIEPTTIHPVPFNTEDDVVPTLIEQLAVAGNTAELQVALGATPEVSARDEYRQKALLNAVVRDKNTKALNNHSTAYASAAFLRAYGSQLALDVSAARTAITNKLMEIANCGDTKFELKALELLGKHSDIGLFTERSEITINYKNPEDLENAIKERVKRLLNADIIDVTPLGMDLDEELGLACEEVEVIEEAEDAEDTGETPE
jgi:hypothetical protein